MIQCSFPWPNTSRRKNLRYSKKFLECRCKNFPEDFELALNVVEAFERFTNVVEVFRRFVKCSGSLYNFLERSKLIWKLSENIWTFKTFQKLLETSRMS